MREEQPQVARSQSGITSWLLEWQHKLLLLILVVAAVVRCWRLGSLPPGIFRDEAEKALNGWFLLHHGVDSAGRPWPVFIEVFGVTTSAVYQYALMPFLAVGGLNEWTARLPAATAGVATVLFTWLFCRRVCGLQTATWAAGLLAVSPWHVPLSRWAQQGVFLPLLFVMAAWGVAGFLKLKITDNELQKEDDTKRGNLATQGPGDAGGTAGLMFAAACMGIAMYAYDPARLFAPLLGLAAAALWWRNWAGRGRAVVAALLVFLIFSSPVIWLLLFEADAAQARFRHLTVFQPNVSPAEALAAIARNYIWHFSPDFLLLRGDAELRHSGGTGMLNLAEFCLAIAGVIVSVRRKCRWGIFLTMWILAAPIAASLTRIGVPHALRSQVALPAWQVMAALGLVGISKTIQPVKRKTFQQLAALIILISALPFFISYFGSYSRRSAVHWQYGVKQSLQYLNTAATQDGKVIFHNVVGAEYLVPFYLKMNRPAYQRLMRGVGRYQFLPFQFPDRVPPADVAMPAAWITPPGYVWPQTLFPIPISAPAGEQMPPAMLIYLNQQLLDQVKEQTRN